MFPTGGGFKRGEMGFSELVSPLRGYLGAECEPAFRRVSSAALRAGLLTQSKTGWNLRRLS
jgi:hypothetical protein